MTADRQERVRTEILEAAAGAIAERGYHGMSMRELAKATHKGVSTFYNYFDSKEDVLFSIQSRAFDSLIASATEAIGAHESPSERLHAFIENHVRYFGDHEAVMRVLVHSASALPVERRSIVRRKKERYFQIGRGVVLALMNEQAPVVDSRELDRTTYGVFGMLNWTYTWYEPADHGTPAEIAQTIHSMAVGGLSRLNRRRATSDERVDGAVTQPHRRTS